MEAFGGFISGVILGAIVFYFVGHVHGERFTLGRYQVQIIERGYGQYCPTTGKFAFIGECDVSTR
jgi:hypothetical protein